MSNHWKCPKCGEVLVKGMAGMVNTGAVIVGTATCGKCGATVQQSDVYAGKYDIGVSSDRAELGTLAGVATFVLISPIGGMGVTWLEHRGLTGMPAMLPMLLAVLIGVIAAVTFTKHQPSRRPIGTGLSMLCGFWVGLMAFVIIPSPSVGVGGSLLGAGLGLLFANRVVAVRKRSRLAR